MDQFIVIVIMLTIISIVISLVLKNRAIEDENDDQLYDENFRLIRYSKTSPKKKAISKLSLTKIANVEKLKTMIEAGADVNAKDEEGKTLLHNVATFELAKVLIDAGANVNARNNEGESPLHWVQSAEIAKLFIEAGADVNAKDEALCTPLHSTNQAEVAKVLIEAGADITAMDTNLNTVLHTAQSKETVLKAIKAGINVNSRNKNGETPLLSYRISAEAEKALIEAGADITAMDTNLNTVLHTAQSKEIVLKAIEAGLDVNAINKEGNTPLHWVENLKVLKALIEAGADVKKADQNYSLLISNYLEEPQIVKILLFEGADPNNKNADDLPLCEVISLEIVKVLIAGGADPSGENVYGQSVLKYWKDWTTHLSKNVNKEEYEESKKILAYLKEIQANPGLIKEEKARFEEEKKEYLKQKAKDLETLNHFEIDLNNDENEISDAKTEQNPPLKKEQRITEPFDTQTINNSDSNNSKEKKEVKAEFIDKAALLEEISNEEQFWGLINKQDYSILEKLKLLGIKELYNKKNTEGAPLLQVLVKQKQLSWLKNLLEAGADPNIADSNGDTALHTAILENTGAAFISLLLQNNARVEEKNNQGLNAHELALQKENLLEKEVILKLLNN